jgi:hypothetical protein
MPMESDMNAVDLVAQSPGLGLQPLPRQRRHVSRRMMSLTTRVDERGMLSLRAPRVDDAGFDVCTFVFLGRRFLEG